MDVCCSTAAALEARRVLLLPQRVPCRALPCRAGAYTPAYLARRDRLAGGSGRSLAYVLGNMLRCGQAAEWPSRGGRRRHLAATAAVLLPPPLPWPSPVAGASASGAMHCDAAVAPDQLLPSGLAAARG